MKTIPVSAAADVFKCTDRMALQWDDKSTYVFLNQPGKPNIAIGFVSQRKLHLFKGRCEDPLNARAAESETIPSKQDIVDIEGQLARGDCRNFEGKPFRDLAAAYEE